MKLVDSLNYQPVDFDFGTSGLRGLVKDLTDLETYINSLGFIRFLIAVDSLKTGEDIYIGGDFRSSTGQIMQVVAKAILQAGYRPVNCGLIPTPALAYYGLINNQPSIMVTGSHIPDDRNGIKFHKREGEVLKSDELKIKQMVAQVRGEIYDEEADKSMFNDSGQLKTDSDDLGPLRRQAEEAYLSRYTSVFGGGQLRGKTVVVFQQSAVARDIMVKVIEAAGAKVVAVERLDYFLPIDTENVTPKTRQLFKKISLQHPGSFAIVSADGDSDRPFVVDSEGNFHRGDVLGALVADYLKTKYVAVPVSLNDAVDLFCQEKGITLKHTRIGSPYVVEAIEQARLRPAAGWEVNGGFMLANDIKIKGQTIKALPTRDALLPIICCLVAAAEQSLSIKQLFDRLPKRYTGGALIDNVDAAKIKLFRDHFADEKLMDKVSQELFKDSRLGPIKEINLLDGLRLKFKGGDIIHFRPSGNAPQFRVYSNCNSQAEADKLAAWAVKSGGYIEQMLDLLSKEVG